MRKKQEIYRVLAAFRKGELNKYEAMELLSLDDIQELLLLLSHYEMRMEPASHTPEGAPSLKEYFTNG